MMLSQQLRSVAGHSMFSRVAYVLAGAAIAVLAGCGSSKPVPHVEPAWPTLPLAAVPDFMHATLYERVRFGNTEPLPIYGYSLVVNLHDTGDSTAPTFIRDYVTREILLRGFESLQHDQYQNLAPDQILADKRVAIVLVEGRIPVGARAGQSFDVIVHALPRSHTTSLAHGELYETSLSDHGRQNPTAIGARVLGYVHGGPVFVNPAYALTEGNSKTPGARESLRTAIIMDGGVVKYDRPIDLQLRQPQLSTARLIEELIRERWQEKSVAEAEEEGLVQIYVPVMYRGDWKHFEGVVSHMFLNNSPEFIVAKAKQLVAEAHKPNAPLADISLCWEAMGQDGLSIFEPLISDPNPDIAYSAARAAAFCGDSPAREALLAMASDPNNKNQLDAVKTLGALPPSPETTHMLRLLMNTDKADVRIAAYRDLADNNEGIFTHEVGDRFYLDLIDSSGPPLVYATSTGIPRLAIFGHDLSLQTPITFMAMNDRFSISSSDGTNLLTMFYRDPESPTPTNVLTHNDLPEIVARLGGEGPDEDNAFNFNFSDVVAITQQLIAGNNVTGEDSSGNRVACVFELEHPPLTSDQWQSIPAYNEGGRPQGSGGPIVAPTPAKGARASAAGGNTSSAKAGS